MPKDEVIILDDKECEILLEKIKSMADNAPSNLHEELYPKKLGQAIMMQAAELRLSVLARYEGMSVVLKNLGPDVKKLEDMIESEGQKTVEGKY